MNNARLAAVLDTLIPPADPLPGAGELGLAGGLPSDIRPVVDPALAALPENFASLPVSERAQLLNDLSATQPAFVPTLVFHTYLAYYSHDRVVEALGLETRPPYPEGYDMEPSDLTLLDPVRESPRRYRDA
jgi:hypothetical protein